jgi:adenylate kinase
MTSTIKRFCDFINERVIPDKQGEILVLLGPPGSGKGTLSKKLVDEYGFQHISTGDLIRKSDDEELKKTIAGGNMISDSDIRKMVVKELNTLDLEKGIIFDGYPRNIKQAKALNRMLGKRGVGLNHAVFLDLPEDIAKERLVKRAEEEGREDDASMDSIDKRFSEYTEKTIPLIDSFRKSRKLITIDAEKGRTGVLEQVVESLGLKKP